jgi:deazaflavin-dependent oxidoreductase (nitroreductase family)
MTSISASRPGTVMQAAFRSPIRLYDAGLGWLLCERFLCLTHIGRKTGRHYRTVLEVVGTNPTANEHFVLAGFGPSSDWYRNIDANPARQIIVGRKHFSPQHRVLDEAEAVVVIADYERRNRWMLRIVHFLLTSLLGWRYDGSHEARARLVRQLPVVAFRPRTEDAPQAE